MAGDGLTQRPTDTVLDTKRNDSEQVSERRRRSVGHCGGRKRPHCKERGVVRKDEDGKRLGLRKEERAEDEET